MARHLIFLILIFRSGFAQAEAAKPVDIQIRFKSGRAETHFAIKCNKDSSCTLERSRAADKTSRPLENEDVRYYLEKIAKLPKEKGVCERRSITITGATDTPLEDCVTEAYLKFIRGLDAAL